MLTEKYNFRISDTMAIPLRPNWISNNAYREKCKMLILNRSKGDFHKVDFSKIIDYIKKGDVVCFNDSTIINNMFICKTKRNRLIKIVLEGFLPENRVIISGLLKEKFDAHEVLYLADNFDVSFAIGQKFSEKYQYQAVVENHDAGLGVWVGGCPIWLQISPHDVSAHNVYYVKYPTVINKFISLHSLSRNQQVNDF